MAVLFNSRLNHEYRIVYRPNFGLGIRRRSFFVSANRLSDYIGSFNANTALLKAEKMRTDRIIIRFRKYGTIYIYLK